VGAAGNGERGNALGFVDREPQRQKLIPVLSIPRLNKPAESQQ
jgi:hypothetical protein